MSLDHNFDDLVAQSMKKRDLALEMNVKERKDSRLFKDLPFSPSPLRCAGSLRYILNNIDDEVQKLKQIMEHEKKCCETDH